MKPQKEVGYTYFYKGEAIQEYAPGVVKQAWGTLIHRLVPMYACHVVAKYLQESGLLRRGVNLPALIDAHLELLQNLPPVSKEAA